jgi:predicted DNA-binding transcriptional regulator YafY
MKITTSFRRHYLIIEFIRRRKHATLQEVLYYLHEHGLEIVERTLQRDIEGIRSDYQINIEYSPADKGYSVNEDSVLPIDDFLHFLEVVNFSELMIESLSEVKETFRYIQFENTECLKGIHQLKDILFAIRNRRVLNFKHENFWKGTISNVSMKPLLIKEYQKRWYVVGIYTGDELRTFGVDRISELEVTDKVFKVKKEWNAAENFSRVIGITYEGERAQVILSFDPFQGKYIKTLPLHSSQQVIIDNKNEFRISLDVVINHELIQRILMYGENVQVIAPLSLRKEIRRVLTESLSFYKKL